MSTHPKEPDLFDGAAAARIAELERRIADLEKRVPEDRVTIVVFSGDLDRVLAAFIIATGAAAMGQTVTMFFTFWGLTALRRKKVVAGKGFMAAMMAVMTPGSSRELPVSRLNFFGAGAGMLRAMMKEKKVASLEELMSLAREMGIQIIACEMSRDVMDIGDEELAAGAEHGGVASFLGDALVSRTTLFI